MAISTAHRNRIIPQELAQIVRTLPLRPQQRRLIQDAFSRYGTEGITREEFEAAIHRLRTDRQYYYALKPKEIERVRQALFPRSRPMGAAPAGERPAGRPTLPDRPRLRGLSR